MENGIIKEIDVQNIFASSDNKYIFVPIIIDQTKVLEDLNLTCYINKNRYTISKNKPTKLVKDNKSNNITYNEIKSQFDTLSRKIFAKNISIKTGQLKSPNLLLQKSNSALQRATVYFTISKSLVDKSFKEGDETLIRDPDHYFKVYITNRQTGQIIERKVTPVLNINPYDYFSRINPSPEVLNDILKNFSDSLSFNLSPYYPGFFAPLTGLQVKWNNSIFANIRKINPEMIINITNLSSGNNDYYTSSPEGNRFRPFDDLNRISFEMLNQKRLIHSIIANAVDSENSQVINLKVTIKIKTNNNIVTQKTKNLSIEKSKILNIAKSFYDYHLDYYFGTANIFDDNSIDISNGIVKITPNREVIENNFVYESIKNAKFKFIDIRSNNRVFNKIFFDRREGSYLESVNGFFIVKDILNKNISSFFIKPNRQIGLNINSDFLVVEVHAQTKVFRVYPDSLPQVQEGAISECDESDFARSLIESCEESDES